MTKLDCTCKVCGVQFKAAKGKRNIYCKMECYRVAQRRGDYLGVRGSKRKETCTNCAKPVIGKSKSRKQNGTPSDNIFCDRDCYDSYRAAIRASVFGQCRSCNKDLSKANGVNIGAIYCGDTCRRKHERVQPRHCMSCDAYFTPVTFHAKPCGGFRYSGRDDTKTCSYHCYTETIRNNEARKQKISEAFTGDKHPNWLGGKTAHGNRSFRGAGWGTLREKIRKRDGNKCLRCGITNDEHVMDRGYSLHVNHIIPFWQYQGNNAAANNPSNLETLCHPCHMTVEWQYRKNNHMQLTLQI